MHEEVPMESWKADSTYGRGYVRTVNKGMTNKIMTTMYAQWLLSGGTHPATNTTDLGRYDTMSTTIII